MRKKLTVKPAEKRDLEVLNARLRSPILNFHEEKINLQEKGEVVWLIAWIGKEPVGQVLIRWQGATDEPVRQHEERYPYLQNLAVKINYQRKGIGTQIVFAAEKIVKNKGYKKVGMAVGVENEIAQKLYNKLGYKSWDNGTYSMSWHIVDPSGKKIEESETCTYLIKEL